MHHSSICAVALAVCLISTAGAFQLRKEPAIKVTNASFSEAGYQQVVGLRNDEAMKQFVMLWLKGRNKVVTSEDSLDSLIPLYSGTKLSQSWGRLQDELAHKEWIIDASSAAIAHKADSNWARQIALSNKTGHNANTTARRSGDVVKTAKQAASLKQAQVPSSQKSKSSSETNKCGQNSTLFRVKNTGKRWMTDKDFHRKYSPQSINTYKMLHLLETQIVIVDCNEPQGQLGQGNSSDKPRTSSLKQRRSGKASHSGNATGFVMTATVNTSHVGLNRTDIDGHSPVKLSDLLKFDAEERAKVLGKFKGGLIPLERAGGIVNKLPLEQLNVLIKPAKDLDKRTKFDLKGMILAMGSTCHQCNIQQMKDRIVDIWVRKIGKRGRSGGAKKVDLMDLVRASASKVAIDFARKEQMPLVVMGDFIKMNNGERERVVKQLGHQRIVLQISDGFVRDMPVEKMTSLASIMDKLYRKSTLEMRRIIRGKGLTCKHCHKQQLRDFIMETFWMSADMAIDGVSSHKDAHRRPPNKTKVKRHHSANASAAELAVETAEDFEETVEQVAASTKEKVSAAVNETFEVAQEVAQEVVQEASMAVSSVINQLSDLFWTSDNSEGNMTVEDNATKAEPKRLHSGTLTGSVAGNMTYVPAIKSAGRENSTTGQTLQTKQSRKHRSNNASAVLMNNSEASAASKTTDTMVDSVCQPRDIEVRFQPGLLGIGADWALGQVVSVLEDTQAMDAGVQVNWTMSSIDGEKYSETLIDKKIAGTESYAVVFREDPCQNPAPADAEILTSQVELPDQSTAVQAVHKVNLSNHTTFVFQPGPLGIGADWNTGEVVHILPESQAARVGIQPGLIIRAINGQPYQERLIDQSRTGDKSYQLTFEVPVSQAELFGHQQADEHAESKEHKHAAEEEKTKKQTETKNEVQELKVHDARVDAQQGQKEDAANAEEKARMHKGEKEGGQAEKEETASQEQAKTVQSPVEEHQISEAVDATQEEEEEDDLTHDAEEESRRAKVETEGKQRNSMKEGERVVKQDEVEENLAATDVVDKAEEKTGTRKGHRVSIEGVLLGSSSSAADKLTKQITQLRKVLEQEASTSDQNVQQLHEVQAQRLREEHNFTASLESKVQQLRDDVLDLTKENARLHNEALRLQERNGLLREELQTFLSNMAASQEFLGISLEPAHDRESKLQILRELDANESVANQKAMHQSQLKMVEELSVSLLQIGSQSADSDPSDYVRTLEQQFEWLAREEDVSVAHLNQTFQEKLTKERDQQTALKHEKDQLKRKKAALLGLQDKLRAAVTHLEKTTSYLEDRLHGLQRYMTKVGEYKHRA